MYNPNQIKEKTLVIYQEGEINFRVLDRKNLQHYQDFREKFHSLGLLPIAKNRCIHVRLFSSVANVKIDGFEIDELNKNFLQGNTPFIILENSGKFRAGAVNYITFEGVEIENSIGIKNLEVKIKISVIEERAPSSTKSLSDWVPNTYYEEGDDVIGPDNRLYNCTVTHTSTTEFELSKFERQGSFDDTDVDDFIKGLSDLDLS